jgi:hypothetical protein
MKPSFLSCNAIMPKCCQRLLFIPYNVVLVGVELEDAFIVISMLAFLGFVVIVAPKNVFH